MIYPPNHSVWKRSISTFNCLLLWSVPAALNTPIRWLTHTLFHPWLAYQQWKYNAICVQGWIHKRANGWVHFICPVKIASSSRSMRSDHELGQIVLYYAQGQIMIAIWFEQSKIWKSMIFHLVWRPKIKCQFCHFVPLDYVSLTGWLLQVFWEFKGQHILALVTYLWCCWGQKYSECIVIRWLWEYIVSQLHQINSIASNALQQRGQIAVFYLSVHNQSLVLPPCYIIVSFEMYGRVIIDFHPQKNLFLVYLPSSEHVQKVKLKLQQYSKGLDHPSLFQRV